MKPRKRVIRVSVTDQDGILLDSVELTIYDKDCTPAIDRVQVRLASSVKFDPTADADLMIGCQQVVY